MGEPVRPQRELEYVDLAEVEEDILFRLRPPGDVSALARSIAQVGQLFPVELRRASTGLWQPVTGFRRLAALRMLHRDRVLARLHESLADPAAALLAASDALDNRTLERDDLEAVRERYRSMGWSSPSLEELLSRALEKAGERIEDLGRAMRGEPPLDRSVPDEDGAQMPAPIAAALVGAGEHTVRRGGEAAAADAMAARAAEVGAEPPQHEVTADELAEDVAYRLSELTQDLAALADFWDEVPVQLRGIISDQLQYYSHLGAWLEQGGES